jgi:hypothetical protein
MKFIQKSSTLYVYLSSSSPMLKVGLWIPILTALLTLNWGCEEGAHVRECTSDADCRSGYSCDLLIFVGECVQQLKYIPCGEDQCFVPDEMCVDQRCVDSMMSVDTGGVLIGGDPMNGGEAGTGGLGGDSDGPAGGDPIGGEMIDPSGGEMVDPSGGEMGAGMNTPSGGSDSPGGEAIGGDVPPQFEISIDVQSPAPGALLPIGRSVSLSGVLSLSDDRSPQNISLELITIRPGDTVASPPLELPVTQEGRFEIELDLVAGAHACVLSASYQGVEAYVSHVIRLDDFVSVQGVQLSWASAPYRYFGINLPNLIPWLYQLSEEDRRDVLRGLLSDWRSSGVSVLRLFVGSTEGDWAILSAPQELNEELLAILDLIIEEAGYSNFKLILTLGDAHGERGGWRSYLRWAEILSPRLEDDALFYQVGPSRSIFIDFIQLLPARVNSITQIAYRDEPTILGWELLHVPHWDHLEGLSTEITSFLNQATSSLSQTAPHQLIWTGEVGRDRNITPYQPYGDQLRDYQADGLLSGAFGGAWSRHLTQLSSTLSGFTLDTSALGIDPLDRWSTFGQIWIRAHGIANVSAQRPLTLNLVRVDQAETMAQDIDQPLSFWLNESRSQGLSGVILGDYILGSPEAFQELYPQDLVNDHFLMNDALTLTRISRFAQAFMGPSP